MAAAMAEGLDLGAPSALSEVYRQLGHITRQLHDALYSLGVMPKLAQSAQELPDARSRLSWIVQKSGDAAHRTLSAVERSQAERERIEALVARLSAAVPAGEAAVLDELRQASRCIGHDLSDIMLAQDFHDLTGQVVTQVLALALELEHSLVELLLRAAPTDAQPVAASRWTGPAAEPRLAADRVKDQHEVDELLAGLGF